MKKTVHLAIIVTMLVTGCSTVSSNVVPTFGEGTVNLIGPTEPPVNVEPSHQANDGALLELVEEAAPADPASLIKLIDTELRSPQERNQNKPDIGAPGYESPDENDVIEKDVEEDDVEHCDPFAPYNQCDEEVAFC